MIVACEKCRKKYEIDPEKFEGEVSRFRCTSCGNVITVSKSMAKTPNPSPPKAKAEKAPSPALESFGLKRRKIGLRGKIFLILFVVPIFIFMLVLAVPFTVGYFNQAVGLIVNENTQYAVERSKTEMNQMATSIASQVEVYLAGHPELKREDLTNDDGLRKIIFQRASLSGEASLYLRFDPETREPLGTFLINRNKNVEGQPLTSLMVKGTLGKDKYDEFGKLIPAGSHGEHRVASDFYLTKVEGGILKERILACSPVAQTPYGIAATAETDDFMLSAKQLEGRVRNLLFDTRNILIGVFGGTLLLIGMIILLYIHSVTGKIRYLTEVAYRISVGELGAEIGIKSNDEIGDLADAISRMQDSIRLSIERLRRRTT
ncbi:MAG TPA: zinc-ribbon domain-containing protein [Thermodesulfobacteriota bacterium]|jgi:HAMP domain-containing protein|nr:zinc-ribbon domain-containing protein [Thermodesulfobacteriota bacterium]